MLNITDNAEFDKQIESGYTLVDFHAQWCGPCKMLSPIVEEAAEIFEGKINIVKVDADECAESTAKFGVRGIPTLMIFKDGQPVATKVGVVTLKVLTQFIEDNTEATA